MTTTVTTAVAFNVVFYDYDALTILKSMQVVFGGDAIPPMDPAKPAVPEYHYDFVGWNVSFTNVQSDLSVYPVYATVPNVYTLTYLTNGGSTLDPEAIAYGTTITLGTTTKEYCTFLGWFVDAEWTIPWTESTMPAHDQTLYAKWAWTSDADYAYDIVDEAAVITHYLGDDADVTIPTQLGGYPVRVIGANAFENNATIVNLVIPAGVTDIRQYAFYRCSVLRSVHIPGSVLTLGIYAFSECGQLATLAIADGLVSIGMRAFMGDASLTDVVLPQSVKNIGTATFANCAGLVSILLPAEVDSFGNSVFWGCSSLVTVVLPDGIQGIDYGSFYHCVSLISVDLPTSVVRIGNIAFSGCTTLTEILIRASVATIGNDAFAGCSLLTIFAEVESQPVGWSASWNPSSRPVVWSCSGTAGLIYSLTGEGTYAVSGYVGTSLLVVIPASHEGIPVTAIAPEAFKDNFAITSVSMADSITAIGTHAFYHCASLASIELSSQLLTIGDEAFTLTSSLQTIAIPATVTTLGFLPFFLCASLTNIEVDADNAFYASRDGVLFNKDVSVLIRYPAGRVDTVYDMPGTVAEIAAYAFNETPYLTILNLPSALATIGNYAFRQCVGLTAIFVALDSATFASIDGVLFDQTLTTLIQYPIDRPASVYEVPTGVETIGTSAFADNSHLTEIVLNEGLLWLNSDAFAYCHQLVAIHLPASLESIGGTAFYGCFALTSILIPIGTRVGYYAFGNCYDLTIYAEALSRPADWDDMWNPSDRPVVWGHVSIVYHDVTFYAADEITVIATYAVAEGDTSPAPADPVKPANLYFTYSFTGWDTNYSNVTGDLNVYPLFAPTPIQYTLTFVENGGEDVPDVTAAFGVVIDILNSTKEGFAFDGWYRDEALTEFYADAITTMPAENMMLYAAWIEIYVYSLKGDGTYAITAYTGSTNVIVIPSFHLGIPVTEIANFVFENLTHVTAITLPSGLVIIGSYAFYNCSSLSTIDFPETVTTIGGAAFANCWVLNGIVLPEGLTYLGSSAFSRCFALTTINIPVGINYLRAYTFGSCVNLTSITLPDTMNTIDDGAFEGCSALTSIVIPVATLWVDIDAFKGCSLITINVKADTQPAGWHASWNPDFRPVVWGYGHATLTFVENGGSDIDDVTADYSTWIDIENPTKTGYSFAGWFEDAELNVLYAVDIDTMPAGNYTLYAGWWVNTYWIWFATMGGTGIDYLYLDYGATFDSPVTTKTGYTFAGWYEDEELTVFYAMEVTTPAPRDLQLYAKWEINEYTLMFVENGGSDLSDITAEFGAWIDIQNPTREGYTFAGWYSDSERNVWYAFEIDAMPADTLTLFAEWTLNSYTIVFNTMGGSEIDDITAAFGTTFDNPVPIRTGYAFAGWYEDEARTVYYGETVTTVAARDLTLYADWGTAGLAFTNIGGSYSVSNGSSNDSNVIIPKRHDGLLVTTIGYEGFRYRTNIVSFTLPSSVTSAGDLAFSDCSNLTSVNIPANMTVISYGMFYMCTSLTEISIPQGVTNIGVWAFSGCNNLTNLTIPASVTIIGAYAFRNCTALSTFTFQTGSQLTTINTEAFRNCSSLSGITIPAGVTNIAIDTFRECAILTIYAVAASAPSGWVSSWNSSSRPVFWAVNDQSISFDSNGGSALTSISQDYGTVVSAPADPIKTGYAFAGWFLDEAFTVAYVFTTMPAESVSLYAKWITDMVFDYVAIGRYHVIAFTVDNRVFTWGLNNYGQLGNDTTVDSAVAVEITDRFTFIGDEYIKWVDTTDASSILFTSTGRIFTWGYNSNGVLANGTTTDLHVPTDVTAFFGFASGEFVEWLSTGVGHGIMLTSEGRVLAWGWNQYGQIGDTSMTDRSTPVDITSNFALSGGEIVVQVVAGGAYSAVLTSTGRLFTFGHDYWGQLCNGSSYSTPIPTNIIANVGLNTGETVIEIQADSSTMYAFTSADRIIGWGANNVGELGFDGPDQYQTGVDITTYLNPSTFDLGQVVLSFSFVVILTTDGRVFTWGSNANNELGNNTSTTVQTPTDITAHFNLAVGESIVRIVVNGSGAIAKTSAGRTFVWGSNAYGQYGIGNTTPSLVPVEVDWFTLAD
ncbi:MAG: hypothetical protein A2Y16_01540 [Tenericutes bacterium GWF2_57_13]|nr:MAG: hypothetical protein A2Y16_01540 [Tenericutes bacterium GWF2_57_13]